VRLCIKEIEHLIRQQTEWIQHLWFGFPWPSRCILSIPLFSVGWRMPPPRNCAGLLARLCFWCFCFHQLRSLHRYSYLFQQHPVSPDKYLLPVCWRQSHVCQQSHPKKVRKIWNCSTKEIRQWTISLYYFEQKKSYFILNFLLRGLTLLIGFAFLWVKMLSVQIFAI